MKRAARKQVKKFGKGGLNRYASMMADKLKSPKMSPTERDRIQRAVDQGFTNIVYHSTDTPWDEIDLNYTDVGLHAGTPTQAANRALDKAIEAKLQERREQGQYIDTTNVLPLAYRPGKTLRMPDVGEFKDAYTTLLDMRTAPELRGQGWMHTLFDDVDLQKNAYPGKQSKDWLDSIENRMALAEIRQNLRDQGFRQIVYPNTHENAYGELTNLLPEYQDRLDQLSRNADALYQKSLSMRPQAPQPGATEQEIEAFLHPRDPLSYLNPEEAALYNKYRNEMERIEFSPGAYETGESIIFLDPADVRSVYANFAPEAAQETGLGKKQGGPVYDPSRINQMVDDLLDPMYEFEPYDDEAYEVQQFAKGGLPTPQRQWLKDAVENEVKRFQQTTAGGMDPQQALQQLQQSMQEADFQALPEGTRNAFQRSQEDLQRKAALNAWLGGTATKYIKRDYGTEQDPLTQLQMRHAEGEWPPRAAQGVLGRPPQVMGLYETTASRYTDPRAYGDSLRYNEEVLQSNPWLRNLPADQPIYRAVDVDALGMPHLVDEIQNAMNPSAGLPRNLQIRPESLQRMSFPQASELVGKINQYRAEQMAAANAQRATNPATQLVKQYPEGYRWVQITPDADIPEGWERLNSGDYKMPDGTITSRGWAERAVGDALKYEGDTMGHCVGGYCDSVMSGASRIYSLRDAQGMPHVTIEAVPEFHPEEADFDEYWNALKPRLREQGEIPDRNEWFDKYLESTSDFAEQAAKLLGNRQRIIQIKGKGNRAPVDQYVPFVQDFVRSQDWTDVQELNNARLRDATREFSGRPQPQQRYMTDAEYDDYLLQLLRDEQAPGMKEGGDVKKKSMLDELAEAVLAGSAGFGAQVTPDEYGNRGLVSATLSTPELLGLIPGGAQYIPAASGVASADYDEHLNNMLARYGLAESADLDTLDKFALAMGETVGQIPILPARGAAALKRFAPALFEARTIPGARAVDMVTRPVRAAAEYFSPTAEISPSMLAAATGIGGGLRTYFGNDPIAEPSNDADYDDLMQMLRRNAAIDLPSTRELTAKLPARPVDRRFSYEPPRFGFADGGAVEMSKGGLGRQTLQQKAKALGFPSTGSTEQLERLVRAAEADPQTWTQEDFDLLAPHLAIHQDIRPGSAERVESILSEGLRSGMVDPVRNMLSGDFTWARGLRDTDAYLMPYGSLKYQSKDNPRLAPGNMPMLHFRPEPNESMYDAIRRSGKRPVVTKAKGGLVYDPARIESMVNELMEPQKLAKGGLPTPPKGPGKDVPRGRMPDAEAGRIAGAVEEGQRLPVREGPLPAGMARESVVMPGEVGYDIRFDPRVNEQEKLQSSVFRYQEPQAVEIPEISIFDLEGRPFILGMADRTAAGKYLTGINDIDFDIPVGLEGGQGFMFYNPGRVWAADKGPVSAFLNAARRMDEDPLFLPFRMAPTGGDYAHMTAETMLAAARNNMSKKNIKAANSLIRQVIPDFKGIEDIQSIRQSSSASGDQRKAFLGIMDKEFRDKGGLNIGQARLAVSEPEQYQAMDLGLQNVGTIFRGQPRVAPSGHGTYAAAMPGGGLGVLKEKGISAFELLPELVEKRDINIARPGPTEAYTIRRGIRSGVITEDILRQIEKRLAERMGFAQGGLAVAALMPDEQSAEIDAAVDSILAESAATGVSPQDVLLQYVAPIEARAHGGLATYKEMIGA
jgi:chorismate mutase